MQYKVVIVGAGMAGLGAARTLIKHGIDDVLIIEAQDRAGGRVLSQTVGDGIIELGAQWLHSDTASLYHFALEHNLISSDFSAEARGIFVRNDGYIYERCLADRVVEVVEEILDELYDVDDNCPPNVGDYLESEFKRRIDGYEPATKMLWMELFDWNVRFQLIDNACGSLQKLSAQGWGYYEPATDEQYHISIRGGYSKLVNALVKSLPNEIIRYNTAVNSLCCSNSKILVKCNNGVVIRADHVILTSSLGVLKKSSDLIDTLPSDLTTTIDSFGFGGMGKIFLHFERKWWEHDGYQLVWQRDAQLPDNVNTFARHLSGFDVVLNQPNMLLGWLSDVGLREMEYLDEETVGKACVDLLKLFLKRNDIPYPMKVYKTQWLSDEWIRGAYSHMTTDNDRTETDAKLLTTPITDADDVPRILLAGEAASFSQFSTTHGAYASGEDQANVIVQLYK